MILTGRPTISTTVLTGRPVITTFVPYTWDNSPDNWATAVGDWDSYGITTIGTILTGRTIPA